MTSHAENGHGRGPVRRRLHGLWKHLTRSSGRPAALIALGSIVAYVILRLIPLPEFIGRPAGDAAIILASVAVGAWFLPDLSEKLWTLDAGQIRELVPNPKREKLTRALIGAHSDHTEWNKLIWDRALSPLLKASGDPSTYVMNMTYKATVATNHQASVGGRKLTTHLVAVEQDSMRVIGRHDALWISMARTPEALNLEFGLAGCLGRELVPLADLEGTDWQHAVIATSENRLSIGGQTVPLRAEPDPANPDIVRWKAPADFVAPKKRVKVVIGYRYFLDPDVQTFPVMFSNYYCGGITMISLGIDQPAARDLGCDPFVGRALEDHDRAERFPSGKETDPSREIRFSTGEDAILWPGSGVMFRWTPAP